MNEPLVSVLMSVYNGEKYLREAIESILRQTFTDFEFLIINDGSTDGSKGIIESYPDKRIRLINNEKNIGLTKSLNKGIGFAMGRYIARMDADDISMRERLERQVDFMEKNPEYVLCGTSLFTQRGHLVQENHLEADFEKLKLNMFIGNQIAHPTVLIRKHELIKAGMYDVSYKYAQDYKLWFELIARGYLLTNLPDKLVIYNMHDESISIKKSIIQEHHASKALLHGFRSVLKYKGRQSDVFYYRKIVHQWQTKSKISRIKKIWYNYYLLFFMLSIKFCSRGDIAKLLINKIKLMKFS